ncbi:putative U-box domain-containing protein 14 [Iris pallida]|uniref:U-box domain-containing protein 14 n=1 Tax=Iris pallida TaxID=29817 RepID=A0AAX6GT70_IRIPA|nr:putative U-box domain-containing protein 14 [Iris pallida]
MTEEKQRRARSMVSRLAFAATDDALSSHLSSVRHLSRTDPSIRPFLVDAGLVPHLLLHLLHSPPTFQELASATLLNLSITSPESIMATPSLLSSLSHSLDSDTSSDTVLQNVSATLYSLLSVDAYRPIIGSKKPIIKSLLSLLSSPASSARTLKDSLKALFALSLYALNRPVLVSLGAVPSLLALILREPRTGIVEDATAVVAQVAGCCESVDAMRAAAGGGGGLGALVGLARGRGGKTRENVAAALLNLARSGGERAVGNIREVEGVVEVVEAAGTSDRGRAKGEELLKVLTADRRGRRCDCWFEDDSSTQPAGSTSFPSSSSSFPSSSYSYSFSSSSASGDAF